jgi:hypothetical protein
VLFFSDVNGGLRDPIAVGQKLDFRNRSQISAPSHTFEYCGSGTNYTALPTNGGVPIPANEIVETNNGRVYSSNTNEKGDFNVGKQFKVDGTSGAVTISTDEFNLSGLNFIGPFSRNGGISTVGEQLREISNSTSLVASTGAPDGNTAPTQFAVKTYADNKFLQDVEVTANLPLTIADTSTQDSQGFWTRKRRIDLALNQPLGLLRLDANGFIPSALQTSRPQFTGVGVGVAPAAGFGMTLGTGLIQSNTTVSPVSNVYTMNVQSGNRFFASADIAAPTTITISNANTIPAGYSWPGQFTFVYTSGAVTWFPGFTVRWDGGVAPPVTAGERETVIFEVIGAATVGGPILIEAAALRGRTNS